jgi:transcriptional repressor NrdR
MRCPFCGDPDTHVVDTRLSEQEAVRRRRRCRSCDRRFTTYERYDEGPLYIRKRDGGRQPFDRAKLLAGLERAAIKRPVERDALEAIVDRIVAELRAIGGVPGAEQVGELALRGLRDLDPVAYVRFASVYRKFDDVGEFERELDRLEAEPPLQREQLFEATPEAAPETPAEAGHLTAEESAVSDIPEPRSVRSRGQAAQLPREPGGARRSTVFATADEGKSESLEDG